MKDCTTSKLYDSLKFCHGKTILPGIRSKVFYIPKSDIVTWPKLPSMEGAEKQVSKLEELATYKGDFVLASDKKWLSIDLIPNKGQIESEPQGEKPSRTFKNKCSLFHPENDEQALAVARQFLNDDVVFLVQMRSGKFRVLGNEMFETNVSPKSTTGEGVTGSAATTFEVEVDDICPAPYYPGKIETAQGDLSGATGLAA